MVSLEMHGDDYEPLRIEVKGRDLRELLPFLRLADLHGVTATVLPAITEETQYARSAVFDLADAEDLKGLIVFVTAAVLLVKPHEAEQVVTELRNQAVGDMNQSLAPL